MTDSTNARNVYPMKSPALTAALASSARPLADIPNAAGFRLIGLTRDGREIACTVSRDAASGSFTLGPVFATLKAWRPCRAGE